MQGHQIVADVKDVKDAKDTILVKPFLDPKEVEKFALYKKAAADSDNPNQRLVAFNEYQVAWCLENGLGVVADLKEAFAWYEKSAQRNYLLAKVSLVYFKKPAGYRSIDACYQAVAEGKNIDQWEKDLNKLDQSALEELNDAEKAAYAYFLYMQNSKKNKAKLKEAAAIYPRAQFELGNFFKLDELSRRAYFEGAAQNQYSMACFALAETRGRLEKQITPVEMDLYSRSFRVDFKGELHARLGAIYEEGLDGAVANLNLAKEYYREAARLGNEQSKTIMGMVDLLIPQSALTFNKVIFESNHSNVFAATYQGQPVVCKWMLDTEKSGRYFRNEMGAMRQLTLLHTYPPNCVIYVGGNIEPRFIVSRMACNGALHDRVSDEVCYLECYLMLYRIFKFLDFLHNDLQRIHGDIKGRNIFLDEKMQPLVGDFGLSMSIEEAKKSSPVGTVEFRAPELFDVDGYSSPASDVWACGVLMLEMIMGQTPFKELNRHTENMGRLFWKIAYADDAKKAQILNLPPNLLKECKSLLFSCLVPEAERPTAAQLADRCRKLIFGQNSKYRLVPRR